MERKKSYLFLILLIFVWSTARAQSLTYSFIDPCTKAVTNFSVPVQGGTTIFFLGQSRFFTASDVANGTFASWVNQVYSDYRKISPCSVQSASVTRNQITAQVLGSVVSSVMSSLGSSLSLSSATATESSGGNDNASKGKSQSEKKKKTNGTRNNNTNNSSGSSNSSSPNQSSGSGPAGNSGNAAQNSSGSSGSSQGNGTSGSAGGGSNGSPTSTSQGGNQQGNPQSGGNSQQTPSQKQEVGENSSGSSKGSQKGEVVATTTINVDVRNDRGTDGGSSGGSKKSSSKQQKSNPLIVSSDLTSAQNLDKSFTGIINMGISQSSMTGTSSWGVTSMVWLNFKQFALNSRYTMVKFNNSGTLKFIHNLNLTGAYSFGNVFGFLGYSIILNAGKYGITGANVSGAVTKTPDDKNLFISPSVTAFYTKPFKINNRLSVSPEIYIISTPVVYSSIDKVTVTDRFFSGFLGSGFDYQITKRFKFNANYKANLSTNPEFPILSFFLIGSKINL